MKQHREDLDARLEDIGQKSVRQVVRDLPEETLSLAWRSELNEKLRATAEVQRRRSTIVWYLRPLAGLAIAGSMAMLVMFNASLKESVQRPDSGVEAALLAAHEEVSIYTDVTGSGLSVSETRYRPTEHVQNGVDWTEVDIDSL